MSIIMTKFNATKIFHTKHCKHELLFYQYKIPDLHHYVVKHANTKSVPFCYYFCQTYIVLMSYSSRRYSIFVHTSITGLFLTHDAWSTLIVSFPAPHLYSKWCEAGWLPLSGRSGKFGSKLWQTALNLWWFYL